MYTNHNPLTKLYPLHFTLEDWTRCLMRNCQLPSQPALFSLPFFQYSIKLILAQNSLRRVFYCLWGTVLPQSMDSFPLYERHQIKFFFGCYLTFHTPRPGTSHLFPTFSFKICIQDHIKTNTPLFQAFHFIQKKVNPSFDVYLSLPDWLRGSQYILVELTYQL